MMEETLLKAVATQGPLAVFMLCVIYWQKTHNQALMGAVASIQDKRFLDMEKQIEKLDIRHDICEQERRKITEHNFEFERRLHELSAKIK